MLVVQVLGQASRQKASANIQHNPFFFALAASYRISAFKPSIKSDTHSTQCAEVQPLLRWWDAYPEAKSSPPHISPEEVAALLHDPTRSDYAVIDVRRNDHSVCLMLCRLSTIQF